MCAWDLARDPGWWGCRNRQVSSSFQNEIDAAFLILKFIQGDIMAELKMRVMILEDEEIFASQAMDVVRELGGVSTWMTSAEDALEDLLDAQPPYQALILDRILDDRKDSDSLWLISKLRRNGEPLSLIHI